MVPRKPENGIDAADASNRDAAELGQFLAVMMSYNDGQGLKEMMRPRDASEAKPRVELVVDTTNVFRQGRDVDVGLWLPAPKRSCSVRCEQELELLKGVAGLVKPLLADGQLKMQLHYELEGADATCIDDALCAADCLWGQFCMTDPDENSQGYDGRDSLMEVLRQLCLVEVLHSPTAAALQLDASAWWDYKTTQVERCSIRDRQFGGKCSQEVLEEVVTRDRGFIKEWKACAGVADGGWESVLTEQGQQLLQKQLDDKAEQRAGEGTIFYPEFVINGAVYRGSLQPQPFQRALCSAFVDFAEPEACHTTSPVNECEVGGPGWSACRSEENVRAGLSMCKDTFSGYKCVCDEAAYLPGTGNAGDAECVDRNECISPEGQQRCRVGSPDCPLCFCKNTRGSYECHEEAPACTAADGYGGCWSDTIDGVFVHACKDNFDAVLFAAMWAVSSSSSTEPPRTTCECPACFRSTSGGGCELTCDTLQDCVNGACLPTVSSGGSDGGIAWWVVLLIVLGSLAVLTVVLYLVIPAITNRIAEAAVRSHIKSLGFTEMDEVAVEPPPATTVASSDGGGAYHADSLRSLDSARVHSQHPHGRAARGIAHKRMSDSGVVTVDMDDV